VPHNRSPISVTSFEFATRNRNMRSMQHAHLQFSNHDSHKPADLYISNSDPCILISTRACVNNCDYTYTHVYIYTDSYTYSHVRSSLLDFFDGSNEAADFQLVGANIELALAPIVVHEADFPENGSLLPPHVVHACNLFFEVEKYKPHKTLLGI